MQVKLPTWNARNFPVGLTTVIEIAQMNYAFPGKEQISTSKTIALIGFIDAFEGTIADPFNEEEWLKRFSKSVINK